MRRLGPLMAQTWIVTLHTKSFYFCLWSNTELSSSTQCIKKKENFLSENADMSSWKSKMLSTSLLSLSDYDQQCLLLIIKWQSLCRCLHLTDLQSFIQKLILGLFYIWNLHHSAKLHSLTCSYNTQKQIPHFSPYHFSLPSLTQVSNRNK